jgi:hypothetical protein
MVSAAAATLTGIVSAVAGIVVALDTFRQSGPPSASPTPTATATPPDANGGGFELPTIVVVVLVGLVVGAGAEVFRRVLVRRNRRRRERLDELIKANATVDAGALREYIFKRVDAAEHDVAVKQVETYLLDEGPELRAVEAVLLRHPPPLPRAAKRMLNHARLLTRIANEREMFGGEPRLEPDHLGKWIVLAERWPAVARRVMHDPAVLARLEGMLSEGADLATALEACGLDVPASAALADLIGEPPPLSPVIGRLIHFDRAPVA